jgi:hypothetical protein
MIACVGEKMIKKTNAKKVKKPVKLTLTKMRTIEKAQIKKLTKECKALCSHICRLRWDGKCGVCGKEGTAAHHFFGWKACSAVRFDRDNLIWLCYYDHIGKVHQQGLTEPAREAIINKIGQDEFDKLRSRAYQVAYYSVDNLREIKESLLAELSNRTLPF